MQSPKNIRGTPSKRIYQQINQVIHGHKHEVIEGIEIDFRHPKFNPENWEAPRGLFIGRDLGGDGPNLSFPWSERSEEGIDELASSTQPDDSLTPDYILESGDRLYIRKIETVSTDNPLLRGCNPNRVKVYINIQKVKRGLIEVQRPIIMKSRNELWEQDLIGNYYRAIEGRIRDYVKIGDVADIENIPDDRSFAYRALRKLSVINRISPVDETIVSGQKVDVVPDEEYHDNSSIWFTVNDAVALGYLWAKSEDERNYLTTMAQKITEKQAEAGRKSGRSRVKRREQKREITRAIADEYRATRKKEPLLEEIVDYVDDADRWKASWKKLGLPNIPKPARDGIGDFVSELYGSKSGSTPKSGH